MTDDAVIKKLKLRIERLFDQCDQLPHIKATIVRENLDFSIAAIVQMLNCNLKSESKEHKIYFNTARMRLNIAERILEGKACSKKTALKETAQLCIQELSERIVTFKTIVEWKNIELTEEDKANVLLIVELLDQSMSELRFYQCDIAESTALSGLVLQHFLNLRFQLDAPHPLTKITKKAGAATRAAKVIEMCEELARIRQKHERHIAHTGSLCIAWQTELDAIEQDLVKLIPAIAGDDDNLGAKLTKLESQTIYLSKQVTELDLPGAEQDYDSQKSKAVEALSRRSVMSVHEFETVADSVQNALKDKVDDPELLDLRIKGIKNLYRDLLETRHPSTDFQKAALSQSLRAELNRISLFLSQADLFRRKQS